ncbi:MAG: NAD(P)H-dependent oxidoreductase, partial [Litorivicinaceae bacterium]|nr:NAD(P)H-dependent oxidoreductase [Litorivicinaceae bacterium]
MRKNILLVSGSAQGANASSFKVANQVIEKLQATAVKIRDLSTGLPSIDHEWVTANFAEQASRTNEQKTRLTLSDELINEVMWADILIIAS